MIKSLGTSTIDIIFLVFIPSFCVIYILWELYQPRIEIIYLIDSYRINLWYNRYYEGEYFGRDYKCIFKFRKL